MKASRLFLICISTVLAVAGCSHVFYVREQRLRISDIRASAADDLVKELRSNGYHVHVDSLNKKGEILGDAITDQILVIADPDFTDDDVRRITDIVTSARRKDPILLRSTAVEQNYVSASGEGTANVELTIELTGNATAYYKETGKVVSLRREPGQQTATFDYRRRSKEEYVDIYIVPEYAQPGYKPKSFLRISLSYPYEARRMPWETCWTRFSKWVRSLFGKKDLED
jgi:hypothetical protein